MSASLSVQQPPASTGPASGTHAAAAARTQWVHNFAACAGLGAQQIGGKGLGLARMAEEGLPVPPGFCVGTDALHYFLQANQIDLAGVWQTRDAAEAAALAERIQRGRCPEDLHEQIVQAYLGVGAAEVAVRSSAVDEDAADHSFAGQHLTFLHVAGANAVVRHVQACWASLLQPAALAYRETRAATGVPAMAVVVQAMVPADCAGVAFALNPLTGNPDEIIVEACYGLGEGLVAARVSTDGYVLQARPLKLLRRSVQYKASGLGWDPVSKEVKELPIDPALRERPVLSDAQVLAIAEVLQRLSERRGAPQDIEWAYAGGVLQLLQSRPITTKPSAALPTSPHQGKPAPEVDQRALWSRMDIGEIFTGRMTPLGISFARYYQYQVHRACAATVGLLDPGEPDEYMGYLNGHVYLNVAYTAYLLSQSPPGFDQKPFLARFSSEEVDISGYANPYGERYKNVPVLRSSAYWAWSTVRELFTAKSRARSMVATRYVEYDRAMAQDLSALDTRGLRAEMDHALDYFKRMHIGYLPFYLNAFGLYGLLEELCKAWLPGDGQHLQNRLKGDMSNLRTVQSARDLWTLTQSLEGFPRAKALFAQLPAAELGAALRDDAEGRRFLAGPLAEFMRENGVRGHEEMELAHPRWLDDPTYVFQMVKTFLAQGFEVDNRLGDTARNRGEDTGRLLARLSAPKRMVIGRVIAMYSACSRMREETRMSMITSIWLVRRVVCEVVRRLEAAQVLRDASELALLDFGDLLAHLDGAPAASVFPRDKIMASRRVQQAWLNDPDPPLTFIGHARPRAAAEGTAAAAGDIVGLGTSVGRVRGRARVIHDLAVQAGELNKGDIIVTRFTDASWTPLFALAGGVVTDVGSMLSHSSIVAREFGIPSVVNTKTATERIRTGDMLLVDGETGIVQILPEEA